MIYVYIYVYVYITSCITELLFFFLTYDEKIILRRSWPHRGKDYALMAAWGSALLGLQDEDVSEVGKEEQPRKEGISKPGKW